MTVIGITGTRHGLTEYQVEELTKMLSGNDDPLIMHHGDCVGADATADRIARDLGYEFIGIHPPTVSTWRAWCSRAHNVRIFEETDYHQRNRHIVNGSDMLIALPFGMERQQKGGTWMTVRYAESTGIPVTILWPQP